MRTAFTAELFRGGGPARSLVPVHFGGQAERPAPGRLGPARFLSHLVSRAPGARLRLRGRSLKTRSG